MSQVTKDDLLETKRDLMLHIDTKFATLRCTEHEQFITGIQPRVRALEVWRAYVLGGFAAVVAYFKWGHHG